MFFSQREIAPSWSLCRRQSSNRESAHRRNELLGSVVVYAGLVLALAGVALVIRPVRRLGITTRLRASAVMAGGILLVVFGLLAPAPESRVSRPTTHLDRVSPAWQFREYHSIKVAGPPERVFEAIRIVRADEIFLFRALTWIRRGGRPLSESILNAGDREPLLDVALRGGFVRLADDPPRELVIGTAAHTPPGARDLLTPQLFLRPSPGYAMAAMNFLVTPDGPNASVVSTETRVFANGPAARRRFAAYWRIIYPGSAIIRRMWLRAIERRVAHGADPTAQAPLGARAMIASSGKARIRGMLPRSCLPIRGERPHPPLGGGGRPADSV